MHADVLIIGAGIVGLTVARELAMRGGFGQIVIVEKESEAGMHASGRNSGVLHAGIYYPEGSLKAKLCIEGHGKLLQYVENNSLPILKCGKVIVATQPHTVPTLDVLLQRSKANGVEVEKISLGDLKELEPEASSHEYALWSPRTAVIDSKAVIGRLLRELRVLGVEVHYGERVISANPRERYVQTSVEKWDYGHLINCAGVYADRVAHMYDVGLNYRILPFKGLYWKSSKYYEKKVQRLIYPAPDVNMPFLGVHITRTVDGHVLFGPTAIPALGRENYSFLGGIDLVESPVIAWHLLKMLVKNPGGFRSYVRQEFSRYRASSFYKEAKTLAKNLQRHDIGEFYKVGIRAQLFDVKKTALQMDFVIEEGEHSLHVLNAISPAFTSSFAFARLLADKLGAK